jgi:Ala-tRNA(Pro) deacylase
MLLPKLKEFLDSHNIKYVVISHSVAYTAAGIAALTHIPGKELAKTVIVKVDGALAMAVVSASQHVDLALLKTVTGAKSVDLATEGEFKERFPDCEVGAMPPFGNLYGMTVFADESLSHDKEIAFNADMVLTNPPFGKKSSITVIATAHRCASAPPTTACRPVAEMRRSDLHG